MDANPHAFADAYIVLVGIAFCVGVCAMISKAVLHWLRETRDHRKDPPGFPIIVESDENSPGT